VDLEFLDIKKEPNIGNYIFINEKLLNPSFERYLKLERTFTFQEENK